MGITAGLRQVLSALFAHGSVTGDAEIVEVEAPSTGLMRVSVSLSAGSTFYFIEDNGSTTKTVLLNGGNALTAGAGGIFDFCAIAGNLYSFRGGTTADVDRLIVSLEAY